MMITILEAALRTLITAVLVWTLLRLLRVTHVVAQKIAWCLVLVACVAMPFLVQQQSIGVAAPLVLRADSIPGLASGVQRLQENRATKNPSAKASASSAVGKLTVLAARFYFSICSILLLRLFFGLALAIRVWRRAQPVPSVKANQLMVRSSYELNTPFTIGSGIVLPSAFEEWGDAKLNAVLAHERSHVLQGDFYLQVLARLHTAVFWFSPLAWWLQQKLSDLGEAISDHAAIRQAQDRLFYAEILLEFAAMPRRSLMGIAMARSTRINRRIDRILTDELFRRAYISGKRYALLAASIVPLCLLVSMSLVVARADDEEARDRNEPRTVVQSPSNRQVPADEPLSTWVPGAKVYQIGTGVAAPKLIFAPDPEFTDEARRAHYQGVCVIALIVDSAGNPQRPQVVRPPGHGIGQKGSSCGQGI
jgi:beta-lactamase regulating signal transducer with metallopeptidase domain